MVFSKMAYLATVKRKIKAGQPVSIGVFCSGNGDRSPLAQVVLQKAFRDGGATNVRVFSFGTSVSPDKHHTGASARTAHHAMQMGYDLSHHSRRALPDSDVQTDIQSADLLFAISPSHLDLAAEYTADEAPKAHEHVLRKGWTLVGFARKKEWTKPIRRMAGLARGLALKDPYFHPRTPEGESAFRKDLEAVETASKLAVRRLTGR